MIMPVGMITLAQAAGPQRMGRVMSIVGVPMVLAPILGPVLGGLLIEHLSWRWIFYVNLPVGIVGLVLASKLLPAERAQRPVVGGRARRRRGWTGRAWRCCRRASACSSSASASTGRTGRSTAAEAWVPVAVGVGLLAAFVAHALRSDHPLVDVRLFRSRGFAAAGGDDVPGRRRAVRLDAPAALVLPGGARRIAARWPGCCWCRRGSVRRWA